MIMEKKEAMKILKEFHDNSALFSIRTALDTVIPELKESEDEKIRKAIHIYLDWLDGRNKDYQPKGDYTIRDMIAWLENQGNQSHWKPTEEQLQTLHTQLNEGAVTYPDDKRVLTTLYEDLMKITTQEEKKNWQKLADKVEPKFKVGDWIYHNKVGVYPILITDYDEELGYQTECLSTKTYFRKEFVEKEYHLWTIQDAKDGDVLVTKKGNPFIYDKNRHTNELAYYYVGLDVNKELKLKGPHYILSHFGKLSSIFPATNEQRELLFSKMKEAGYEWDAENKELKKIVQNLD